MTVFVKPFLHNFSSDFPPFRIFRISGKFPQSKAPFLVVLSDGFRKNPPKTRKLFPKLLRFLPKYAILDPTGNGAAFGRFPTISTT